MVKNRILVVDDEKDIRDVVTILLERDGYEVANAESGLEALNLVNSGKIFDLIILDIIMPHMDGIDAAKEIRKFTDCPILFLTAKSSDDDKVLAYSSGGDDYLSKPFSRVELLLRVGALLKRYDKPDESAEIIIDDIKRTVTKKGKQVKLTDKEYELLHFLHTNRGISYTIRELYENVWDEKYMQSSSNTVMVHVLNLRKKLEDNFADPKYILTVWGKGYCYAEEKM